MRGQQIQAKLINEKPSQSNFKNKLVRPFLKWAGGKRYLISEIRKILPKFTTYHEPFLGGGAVFFELQPKKAFINDLNSDIITGYNTIKDDVEKLIGELKKNKNTSNHFYKLRDLDRDRSEFDKLTSIQKAARIIFLNKTCFNGLFRVNSQGQFNTPFGGYKNPNYINAEVLRAVSKFLNGNDIKISNWSFEKLLPKIRKRSFVYLDPPYDPVSDTASFTGYNLAGFDKDDQHSLKEFCDKLKYKGVNFLLSNSATDFIQELYKDYEIDIVKVPRAINSDGSKRSPVNEVLVRNYDRWR